MTIKTNRTNRRTQTIQLSHSNARYYDPATGRFLSEDPARDGVSWYGYCGGNPIGYIDPFGLYPKDGDSFQREKPKSTSSGYTGSMAALEKTGRQPPKSDRSGSAAARELTGEIPPRSMSTSGIGRNNAATIQQNRSLSGSNTLFLQTQQNLVGTHYVWGGNNPTIDGGVDCSGGVLYGINQLGNNIPDMTANGIYTELTVAVEDNAQPGDLRFIDYDSDGVMDHVQTIVDINGTRINATGGPTNTASNPGVIEILMGPLPASGEIRRIRW